MKNNWWKAWLCEKDFVPLLNVGGEALTFIQLNINKIYMNYEPIIYKNIAANVGRVIKAGTPVICFERFRLPYRNKLQRQAIREFISLYKASAGIVEEALQIGRGGEVGIPAYVLKFIC